MESEASNNESLENKAYEHLLCGHMGGIIYRLRQMSVEQADFTFAPPAPTSRTLAIHAWQWLICDRQHIAEPDASKHPPVPEPPTDLAALCDAMAAENETWRQLIRSLTPEQLDRKSHQFNIPEAEMSVRDFVCHMIQNVIYKHGQLATIYFALGLDGTEPYSAPFPNPVYEEFFGPRSA